MNLTDLTSRLNALKPVLAIDQQRVRFQSLKDQSEAPTLWEDQANAVLVMAELTAVEKLLVEWDDVATLLELSESLSDADINALEADIRRLEQRALLSGSHDGEGALLTIHAGTGGTDAQDWAQMLERMFLRYIEQGRTEAEVDRALGIDRSNWSVTILDRSEGEEAGIKTVSMQIKGTFAYGLLQDEAGVHRLVRLSPFNAKSLRQTSFALVEVIPDLDKVQDSGINEQDLQIDVYRAGGAGGQHVNTTDSAVRITHKPTGIVVAVQNERSQHQNKATAMKILASKLARLSELKNAEELAILKGEFREGTWGNQIRSYVMQPYQMVKDHRTECETSNIQAVLDGELKDFIEAELIHHNKQVTN
jgi:peptide chain release factor 2